MGIDGGLRPPRSQFTVLDVFIYLLVRIGRWGEADDLGVGKSS